MKTIEQIAEALRTEYMHTVRVKRSRFLHTAWADLPEQYKEPWIAAAKAAYRQILAPDLTLQDPTGDSLIYITVKIGQACCQQAVPRAAILEMPTPEMILGSTVMRQIKEVERRLAGVKDIK